MRAFRRWFDNRVVGRREKLLIKRINEGNVRRPNKIRFVHTNFEYGFGEQIKED